jgi:hypothetical protein
MKTEIIIVKHDFIDYSGHLSLIWFLQSLFYEDTFCGYDKSQKAWYRKIKNVECQIIERNNHIVAHPINHPLIHYDKIL